MASPSVVVGQAEELLGEIRTLDSKFRKSCDQILLLNNQIEDLQVRYDRALGSNRRSYRYSIRLRLATLEGVRNMFYEYAHHCANKLEELQNYLFITGREPYAGVEGEWEPVSSEDEAEMGMNSMSSTTTRVSPSHFPRSEVASRFQFRTTSSSSGDPSRSGTAAMLPGTPSSSGFSNSDRASVSQNVSMSPRSSSTSSSSSAVTSPRVLGLSHSYDTPRQRSINTYNHHVDSPSQSLYSTGRNLEQDSLLEGHSSSSSNSSSSSISSSNSPTSFVDAARSSAGLPVYSPFSSANTPLIGRPSTEEEEEDEEQDLSDIRF